MSHVTTRFPCGRVCAAVSILTLAILSSCHTFVSGHAAGNDTAGNSTACFVSPQFPGFCYLRPTTAQVTQANALELCRQLDMTLLYLSGIDEFNALNTQDAKQFFSVGLVDTVWTGLLFDRPITPTSFVWVDANDTAIDWLGVYAGGSYSAARPPFELSFLDSDGVCTELGITRGLNELACSHKRLAVCKSDLDECFAGVHGCIESIGQRCDNTEGSFRCCPITSVLNATTQTCVCPAGIGIAAEVARQECEAKRNVTSLALLIATLNDTNASPGRILSALRDAIRTPIISSIGIMTQAIKRLANDSTFLTDLRWQQIAQSLLVFGRELLFVGNATERVLTGQGFYGLYTYHKVVSNAGAICLQVDRSPDSGQRVPEVSPTNPSAIVVVCQPPVVNTIGVPTASFIVEARWPSNAMVLNETQGEYVLAFQGHIQLPGAGRILFRSDEFGTSRICARYIYTSEPMENFTSAHYVFVNRTEAVLSVGSVHACSFDGAGIYTLLTEAIDDSGNLAALQVYLLALTQTGPVAPQLVSSAVDVLENIRYPTVSKAVGNSVNSIVNLLAGLPAAVLASANTDTATQRRLLMVLEDYLSRVLIGVGGSAVYLGPRISSSLLAIPMASAGAPLSLSSLAFPNVSREDEVSVSMPSGLVQLGSSGRDGEEYVQVQFSVFSNASNLFMDANNARSSSPVVSVAVGRGNTDDLQDSPINVSFTVSSSVEDIVCSFWDFRLNVGRGGWGSRGCSLTGVVNVSQDFVRVTCTCQHLTHFAVLFSTSGSTVDSLPLRLITVIGAAINLFFLVFVSVTIVAFRKLRREMRLKLLLQMFVAYFMISILLVFSHLASRAQSSCEAFSVLLHYFILASVAWTAVEAYYLHRLLISVFSREIKWYFAKCCAFGWGIPFLIVFVNIAVDKFSLDNYIDTTAAAEGRSSLCFLTAVANRNYFYYAFLLPFCLVLLFDVVIFGRLICVIRKVQPGEAAKARDRRRQVLTSVSVASLVGFNWLLTIGLLAGSDGDFNVVYVYFYSIVMALFGVVVFVVHVLIRKEIRQAWSRHPLIGRIRSQISFTATGSTKTSSMSKNSAVRVPASSGASEPSQQSKSSATIDNGNGNPGNKQSGVWVPMQERNEKSFASMTSSSVDDATSHATSPAPCDRGDDATSHATSPAPCDRGDNGGDGGSLTSNTATSGGGGGSGGDDQPRSPVPPVVIRGTRSPQPGLLEVTVNGQLSGGGDVTPAVSTERLVSPH